VEDLHRHVVDVLDRERLEVDVLVGVGPSNVVRSRIDRLLEHVDRVAKQDYEPDGGADQETDRDLTGETVRVRHRLESEGPAGAQPRRERRVDGLAEVAETALVDGDGDRGRDDGEHAAELEETPLDVVGSRPLGFRRAAPTNVGDDLRQAEAEDVEDNHRHGPHDLCERIRRREQGPKMTIPTTACRHLSRNVS